ncbi:MAG: hypothetical protein WBN22_00415 [Verrucomicrobiia bacterium]
METTEMTDTLKSINTTPHLCRSKVKQTALEIAAAIRPANKFSRVGMSFVERIEAKVRAAKTGKRTSLGTTNEDDARQVIEAKNNSERHR